MKRRLLVVLAVVAVLSALMAAPANATAPHRGHRPFGGEQMMLLNEDADGNLGLYGCEEISWFGTIVLHGKTYGMALYPIDFYEGEDGLAYYEEGWKIFTKRFKLRDGELKRCHPGRVLAAGTDKGTWDMATGGFESTGLVDYASRRFRCWDGRTVHQDGVVELVSFFGLENVFGFYGNFSLD